VIGVAGDDGVTLGIAARTAPGVLVRELVRELAVEEIETVLVVVTVLEGGGGGGGDGSEYG
jgi:hypothetical protein